MNPIQERFTQLYNIFINDDPKKAILDTNEFLINKDYEIPELSEQNKIDFQHNMFAWIFGSRNEENNKWLNESMKILGTDYTRGLPESSKFFIPHIGFNGDSDDEEEIIRMERQKHNIIFNENREKITLLRLFLIEEYNVKFIDYGRDKLINLLENDQTNLYIETFGKVSHRTIPRLDKLLIQEASNDINIIAFRDCSDHVLENNKKVVMNYIFLKNFCIVSGVLKPYYLDYLPNIPVISLKFLIHFNDEIIEINVDQKLRKMETIYQKFEHRIEYEFDPNEECFITVQ